MKKNNKSDDESMKYQGRNEWSEIDNEIEYKKTPSIQSKHY